MTIILGLAHAQKSRPLAYPALELPFDAVTRLASPDGSRVLYGVPYQPGLNAGPQLWIENMRTHKRTMLLSIGSTLSAAWSPDGSAFSVQDHRASDSSRAYIYNANTLERLDLSNRILAVDPDAARFGEGHAYFDLDRWENSQEVILRFHGHSDRPPVLCFEFRYRVSRAGDVTKLSQQVSPFKGQAFCKRRTLTPADL